MDKSIKILMNIGRINRIDSHKRVLVKSGEGIVELSHFLSRVDVIGHNGAIEQPLDQQLVFGRVLEVHSHDFRRNPVGHLYLLTCAILRVDLLVDCCQSVACQLSHFDLEYILFIYFQQLETNKIYIFYRVVLSFFDNIDYY